MIRDEEKLFGMRLCRIAQGSMMVFLFLFWVKGPFSIAIT